ncbi:MAG: DUF1156 domain-containing protein [Armatimonadetes bacterium]|nr:DUF1156 domain-containing protein [Armatimonadota bacterium]MDW8122495.1 DUF1156 domain-containing protein [Armatimonadota bacterium]
MAGKFLIESVLPIKELSAEGQREKAIRHGHLSTLHVWWARRPLVVARAAVLGALLTDDEQVSPEFIANLCQWELHDGDRTGEYLLQQARALIRRRFGDNPPKVLDCFAGGGSIPLEALRLGCDAYALEYNPVAYLILKGTIEYPQRYRQRLVEAVRKWGQWVLDKAQRELSEFYPQKSGETPIAYIWSRTIRCPNPSCSAEIPLFRQFWLARKDNKKVALKPIPDRKAPQVNFTIVEGSAIDFDPSEGTVRKGNAVCLICNASARDDYVKAEAQAGRMGHRLVVVVTTRGKGQGRNYRLATDADLAPFQKAAEALKSLQKTPSPWAFGLPWVPEEPMLPSIGNNFTVSGDYSYGIRRWWQLFNPRQLLALCTFGKWVREAHRQIVTETGDADFAKAVATYLGFAVDFVANRNSIVCFWDSQKEVFYQTFSTHALKMAWDCTECNPFSGSIGSWVSGIGWLVDYLLRETRVPAACNSTVGSAVSLPFNDKTFDAVIIDPPYYDNVPYADLSDFFYVWLRRIVGDLYPEAFQTELTPKDEEAVVNPARFGGGKKGEQIAEVHYRQLMKASFAEIHRVLKLDGLCVVMFTHRSTVAWESLIQSLLDSGLYPTASFPVHTEMEASTHQRGKGAIRSTILMSCRRRPENSGVGWYAPVGAELQRVLPERLREFWDAGIRGADLFISAIGPAVGVFGKYRKVMRPDGAEVTIANLLDQARGIVMEFALQQLGLAGLDTPRRFYVLYRWAYGDDNLDFDDANKLSKGVGVELDELEQTHGLIRRKRDEVSVPVFVDRLTDGVSAQRLKKAVDAGDVLSLPQIDHLHLALWWWHKGEREMLAQYLATLGVADENHSFWRTAQAILEVEQAHPKGAPEKEARALSQLMGSKQGLLHQARRLTENARQIKLEF